MKQLPQRTCMGCYTKKDKKDLIRIVNNNELGIVVDKNSKLEGRGTYICKSEDCLNKVIKSKKLERALKGKIGEEVYNKLRGVIIEG